GIPYSVRFLPLPFIISFAVLCGVVAAVVWLASRRIKKIEPITALRQGVRTHNFKRNFIPLEKTKAPLNFALALKTTLSGMKHNIVVCITMLVLSLVIAFSGLMTENAIVDVTPFNELVVGEMADSCFNIRIEAEEKIISELDKDSRVEKVYLYHQINVSHVGGAELMSILCDDFSQVNNKSVVFKGRFPKFDNELALAAKYADEKGFEIGDEIEITANGKKAKFIICGFSQITNFLGRECLLTRQGYERLGELKDVTYYIDLAGAVDIDAFNSEYKTKFADDVNGIINIRATIDGAGSVYVSLITIIVVAILVLSVIIIAFVLYLLVRTMLNNKMRDYGILKSLGFTTKQLVLQTALSFMPAVLLSTLIGLVISGLVVNPLMGLFLSGIGIVKCTFKIPFASMVAGGAVLVSITFALACLMSLRIRKIAPKAILAAE
ncbi:MAG: hypothetical protein K2L54_05480, partial [Clostridiales bacterium]|nr:hypothetical protein [Clostridiales bacterium]